MGYISSLNLAGTLGQWVFPKLNEIGCPGVSAMFSLNPGKNNSGSRRY